MKKLNFIIRNNRDCDGFTESFIEKLNEKYELGIGIVYDAMLGTRTSLEGITYKSGNAMGRHDCVDLHEESITLDGDILDAMLPYKSMAMHIMMRESQYDVYERAYLEEVYYRHLKYWYTELMRNRINAVFFFVIPHHCGEYICYSLAKILKIPMVILDPQISHKGILFFLGNSIESIGNNIADIYERKTIDLSLDEYMENVVKKIKTNDIMATGSMENIIKINYHMMHQYAGIRSVMKDIKTLVMIELNIEKRVYKKDSILAYKRLIRLKRRINQYLKKVDTIRQYNELSVEPGSERRYLYFPLQVTPEASTMPLAGEFKNQILAIEMVSEVAQKKDILIYVKEHWAQLYREPGFYERLKNIKNVVLINVDENSLKLIEGAVAVVSMTGNCLFEALIKKTPAISIGKGAPFKGAPNLVCVNNKEMLTKALDDIGRKKIEVKDEHVLRYCKAVQEGSVFSYVDDIDEASKYYSKEKTAEKIVRYFEEYSLNEKG